MSERTQQLDIVFDGPPGPESGRFVEVETVREGESIRVGKWIDRGDGTWALRLTAVVSDAPGWYDKDYPCGAAACTDPTCRTHGPNAHVPGTNILDGRPWGKPDPSTVTPLVAPGMTDLMVSPEAIDEALTDLEITSVGPVMNFGVQADAAARLEHERLLAVDPDYACGAAYCDDPACNTHSHRPDMVLKRENA